MSKTYYKVVRESPCHTKYFSFCNHVLPPNLVTEYKIGEYVESPLQGSDLLIFNNLYNVVSFLKVESHWDYCRPYNCSVFKCNAINVSDRGLLLMPWQLGFYNRVKEYIDKRNKCKQEKKPKPHITEKMVSGTLFAQKVKLVELVTNFDGSY